MHIVLSCESGLDQLAQKKNSLLGQDIDLAFDKGRRATGPWLVHGKEVKETVFAHTRKWSSRLEEAGLKANARRGSLTGGLAGGDSLHNQHRRHRDRVKGLFVVAAPHDCGHSWYARLSLLAWW